MPKFYYTYVLRSVRDKNLYIGYSDDLKIRLKEHKQGKVNSTKDRLPVELAYYEACLSKDSAIKREKTLKTGFGRKYLKERLKFSDSAPL